MKIVHRYPLRASVVIAIVFIFFSGIVIISYSNFRVKEFHGRLRNGAISRQEMVFEVPEINMNDIHKYDDRRPHTVPNNDYIIYDTTGKLVYQSPRSKPKLNRAIFRELKSKKELILHENDRTRIIFFHTDDDRTNKMILEVTGYDKTGSQNQKNLEKILLITSLLTIVLMGLGVNFLVRRDLKPVGDIVSQMNELSDTTLDKRLPQAKLKDEFGQMARAFNSLLDRIEKAYSQQKNFVSYATHELRTPLTIMQGQAEVALMKDRKAEEYKDALVLVKNEVKETIKLVNDLLELARANADAHLVDFQQVRVDEVLWQARGQLLQKKHDYSINIEFEDFPESEDSVIINGNASLLKQAFINLMENACKFSDDTSAEVRIIPSIENLQIKIKDEGSGISQDELAHIFEPYYRSFNTSSVMGHGMGLPLTKKIIEIHKGICKIESEVGVGTEITITFPKNS